MKRFRIIKKYYHDQIRFVPQYKYKLFPFWWFTFKTSVGYGGIKIITFLNEEDAQYYLDNCKKDYIL